MAPRILSLAQMVNSQRIINYRGVVSWLGVTLIAWDRPSRSPICWLAGHAACFGLFTADGHLLAWLGVGAAVLLRGRWVVWVGCWRCLGWL